MNRRQFTAGLGALAAAPALPAKALAHASTTGAIPNTARFWAIYMSHLHGTCTPEALAKISGVSVRAAKGYLSAMISDGVITTTRMAAVVPKAVQKPTGLKARLKKWGKVEDDSPPVNHGTAKLQDETDTAATESKPASERTSDASETISQDTTRSH